MNSFMPHQIGFIIEDELTYPSSNDNFTDYNNNQLKKTKKVVFYVFREIFCFDIQVDRQSS